MGILFQSDRNPFDGHRVYNGCPDSTMQRRLDYEDDLLKKIQKLSPGAKSCYFPMEGKTVVHDANYVDISGYHNRKIDALEEALSKLTKEVNYER